MPLDELYDESLILEDGSIADLAYDGEAAPEDGSEESDPETLLLAMLAVADHAESDEEAQAAIAAIAASLGGGEEEQQAEPVQQKLMALRNRLKAAGHKPAGSATGGQFTSGGGGGGAAAPGSGAVSTVLAGLPNKKSYRRRAAAALKVAKEKAVGALQRLSAVIIKADVIPIASDFAREALLKGAGSSNALQGVPLQDVAIIATKALAWAWTRAKKKMGIKAADMDDGNEVTPVQAVHVVMELLYEMMDSPDLPMPSEAEIEKALADRKADAE